MVAEALDIARETYLAILLDRAYGGAVLMGSPMVELISKKLQKIILIKSILYEKEYIFISLTGIADLL